MNPDDIIEQLKRAEFRRGGHTPYAVGLMVTLYVEEAHRPERRAALAACFDDYWDLAHGELRWITQPRGSADREIQYPWVAYRQQQIKRPADWVSDLSADHPWSVTATAGAATGDASTFGIEITSFGAWQRCLSYMTATWPIGFFSARAETFRSTVRRWVESLQPLHGYAGIGLLLPFDEKSISRIAAEAYGLGMRFPGLELDSPIRLVRPLVDGIKGVNWLTVVGSRFVDRLGGTSTLQAQLDDRFETYAYGGGLVIQAGAMPELGDTHRGLVPSAYRDLAGVLTPVRAHLQHSFLKGLSADKALQWLARFD